MDPDLKALVAILLESQNQLTQRMIELKQRMIDLPDRPANGQSEEKP